MTLLWKIRMRILAGYIAIILLLVMHSHAQETVENANGSAEKENLFGASVDLGYVGPNMWAGFQLSNGPCIQPTFTFSVSKCNIGLYMNMYGSERDRDVSSVSTTSGGITGQYKKGLGMCDEVQFFADWSHDWKWFSIGAAFWYLAYTWDYAVFTNTAQNKAICKWFGALSSGELTLSPSISIGPFSLFTDQNVVAVAKSRTEQHTDSLGNVRKNDLGAYHGVLGLSWTVSPVDQCSMELVAKTEWASKKFLDPWLDSKVKAKLKERNRRPHGFYHVTFGAGATYGIIPELSISGSFNVEYITNYWIRINDVKIAKGCIPYAGIHLNYSFGW